MKVFVFLLFLAVAHAKVFERCELARALNSHGMSGYEGISLGDWVCLTKFESGWNTDAVNINYDDSADYGLFQINSGWWCYDGQTPGTTYNDCNINCSQLLSDDITVAVNCAKIIARQQGVTAWYGWLYNCDGADVNSYIDGCGI